MPPWLYPHLHPFERITWEGQRNVRQFIFHSIFHGDFIPQASAWQWVVAYIYGATERWFEGVVGAHWGFRDATEVLLVRLRDHWLRERPDVPFPLDVDEGQIPNAQATTDAPLPEDLPPLERDVGSESLLIHTRSFVELAMEALGSEITAPQEVLW
jgi:hypothetical protein